MSKRVQTKWTSERDDILRRMYPNHSKQRIAENLGVSSAAIYARAIEIGCTGTPKVPWTQTEVDFLFDHHKTMTASQIGRELNRTRQSVNSKAVSLGVECKKPACTNISLPAMIEKRDADPYQKTETGYIFRGLDHVRPQSAQRPDNRTGRYTSLAY